MLLHEELRDVEDMEEPETVVAARVDQYRLPELRYQAVVDEKKDKHQEEPGKNGPCHEAAGIICCGGIQLFQFYGKDKGIVS